MKKLLLLSVILLYLNCKKEQSQGLHSLFISFEKNGVTQFHKGNELTNAPHFTSYSVHDNIRSTLTSVCQIIDTNPKYHNEHLTLRFSYYREHQNFQEEDIDKIFSKGAKTIASTSGISFLSTDTTTTTISYYIHAPPHSGLANKDYGTWHCDNLHENYFEVTSIEKNYSEAGSVKSVIVNADFDLLFCSEEDEKVRLKNGSLRFLFKIED